MGSLGVTVRVVRLSHSQSGHWSHCHTVHLYRPAMLRAAVLLLSLLVLARAQRNRQFEDEDQYGGNDVSRSSSDVGEFPYQRGERPIFNFDQGDEGFIATIPELIEGLDKIKNVMNQQRKITQSFGEAFDQCGACG